MPAAVAEAGLTDKVLPLHQIAAAVAVWCSTGSLNASDGPAPIDQIQPDRREIAS
jgi:hypothetical protein